MIYSRQQSISIGQGSPGCSLSGRRDAGSQTSLCAVETVSCLWKLFFVTLALMSTIPSFSKASIVLRAVFDTSAVKMSLSHHADHMNHTMSGTMPSSVHPPEHYHPTTSPGHNHEGGMMMMMVSEVQKVRHCPELSLNSIPKTLYLSEHLERLQRSKKRLIRLLY